MIDRKLLQHSIDVAMEDLNKAIEKYDNFSFSDCESGSESEYKSNLDELYNDIEINQTIVDDLSNNYNEEYGEYYL